jgi:two-component system, OmpR family, response regulator
MQEAHRMRQRSANPAPTQRHHTVSLSHIAILDDEADITQMLGTYLRSHGYRVTELHKGAALAALLQSDPPALLLLDLGLPGEDGLAIARGLRQGGQRPLGLVIVTGRGDAVDKVVGLEIGADDYITKPFDLRELLARVKAVLRRVAPAEVGTAAAEASDPSQRCLAFAGFTLDRAARCLRGADGNEVALTAGEFALLHVLLQHPGRVLSRDTLLELSRGRDATPFDRTVDVQIGRLRKKLQDDPQDPQIIKSVRGAGYMLATAVSTV